MLEISSVVPFLLSYLFVLRRPADEEFFKRRLKEHDPPELTPEEWEYVVARAHFISSITAFRFQPLVSLILTVYVALGVPRSYPLVYLLLFVLAIVAIYMVPFCDRITLMDYDKLAFPRRCPYFTGRQWIKGIHLILVTVSLAVFLIVKLTGASQGRG